MAEGSTADGPGDLLRASSVSRSFAGVRALVDVTLEVRRHEVVGLIGPNGAGKSTLVNVLSGFDRPDAGAVELGGEEVTGWNAGRRARAGLARTFQHSRAFPGLSVRENVETISGNVNFSPELHTVFGREYRVIEIQDNEGKYFGAVTAKEVPEI